MLCAFSDLGLSVLGDGACSAFLGLWIFFLWYLWQCMWCFLALVDRLWRICIMWHIAVSWLCSGLEVLRSVTGSEGRRCALLIVDTTSYALQSGEDDKNIQQCLVYPQAVYRPSSFKNYFVGI